MNELAKEREKWKQDPLLATYSLFLPQRYRLYKQQEQIIESVIFEPETYVRSYHGAGKTFTAALCVLTFLFVFANSKIVTSAPGWAQVKLLLWAEIRRIWQKSPLIRILEKSNIRVPMPLETFLKLDEDWFAVGLSPKIEKGEEVSSRITGYHATDFLGVLDEGPAVNSAVWEGIRTLLTSSNSHLLAIGNPVDSSGDFYRGFQNTANKRIVLNIFENPNFVANGITSLEKLKELATLPEEEQQRKFRLMKYPFPALTSPKWAVDRMKRWGVNSPLFTSRVLSQFPSKASNSLIGLADLEACRNENIEPRKGPAVLACDVARYGDDDTVIFGVKDWKECYKERYNGQDLVTTANKLIYLIKRDHYQIVVIDIIGLGGGVFDMVRDHFRGAHWRPQIYGVGFNEAVSSEYADTCKDLVTELFKRASELIEERKIGIEDTGDMFAQLTNRQYTYKQGLMVIESKDEYKARTGAGSPDEADAFLYAVYGLTCVRRGAKVSSVGDRVSAKADW